MTNKREKLPGSDIPMDDGQRAFLELHGKFVDNPEMELCMNDPELKSEKDRMKFGAEPLPWEKALTAQEILHLNEARAKTFTCHDKHCPSGGKPHGKVEYRLVVHRKRLEHLAGHGNNLVTREINRQLRKRYGPRELQYHHIGVFCKQCKRLIHFVKFNATNRRLAEDPYISGPHQKRQYRS